MTQQDYAALDRPVEQPIVIPALVKAAKDLPGLVALGVWFVIWIGA